MKKRLPALALALYCAASAAQTGSDFLRAGTLKTVQGTVTLTTTQGPRTAQSGDAVAETDTLTTGADSAASLVMRDGSTLVLGPSSQLDITQFAFHGTTQKGNLFIRLLRGSLRMVTGLVGKGNPDAVRITTPTSVIGVLGTDFIVHAEGGRP